MIKRTTEGPDLPSQATHSLTHKRDGFVDKPHPLMLGPKSDRKAAGLYMSVYGTIVRCQVSHTEDDLCRLHWK